MSSVRSSFRSCSRFGVRFGGGSRLALAGLGALVAALVANLVIVVITRAAASVPDAFDPLKASTVVTLTVIAVVLATLGCAVLNRFTARPLVVFYRLAPVVLVVSFAPDIAIWVGHGYHHTASAKTVIPLMIMHLAVAAACIIVLPALGRQRPATDASSAGARPLPEPG